MERGISADQSAVTVFGGESLRLVNMHHNSPEALLYSIAHTLASTGIDNDDNVVGRMPHVIVLAKEHRDLLKGAGWSKRSMKELIVAAGGDAGRFAAVVVGWSHQSQPVTVALD